MRVRGQQAAANGLASGLDWRADFGELLAIMDGRNRRAEARISLRRSGELRNGNATAPCMVQEISSKGFRIRTDQKYSVGQALVLVCELAPARTLQCKIEVRHVFEECIGTKILEMSAAATALFNAFLKDLKAGRGAKDELDFTKKG